MTCGSRSTRFHVQRGVFLRCAKGWDGGTHSASRTSPAVHAASLIIPRKPSACWHGAHRPEHHQYFDAHQLCAACVTVHCRAPQLAALSGSLYALSLFYAHSHTVSIICCSDAPTRLLRFARWFASPWDAWWFLRLGTIW